jgi:high-affinity iron transporter
MFETLLITFREGLEALLMVAIATLYLRRTGRTELLSALRAGLISAVVACIALGIALAQVGASSPIREGVLAWAAAGVVIWCIVHMLKMGRRMSGDISAGMGKASILDGARAWWAVFAFTVFMVGREGVETATMLASLALSNETRGLALGALVGVGLAATVAGLWSKFGRQVNLSRFFNVTAVFMLAFALMLLLKGLFEFTEVDALAGIDNAYWHELLEPLVEGNYAHLVSVLLVLAPTLWLGVAQWRDQRRLGNSVA